MASSIVNLPAVSTNRTSSNAIFDWSIAFFAITDKGYQDLGLNFSDLRAYVQQQDAIIAAYQGYYKASEDALDDANGQIESAKDQVEEQQPEDNRTLWEKLRGN